MRHLASIQRIHAINAIPGADAIETASVLGWKVVIKKGDFQVGDLVVYCEIDCLLPVREEFEFLRKSCFKKNGDVEGFRIKTCRLRGQVSQGICFSISILPKGIDVIEGADVTKVLGVEQYIPAISAEVAGLIKGAFPSFASRTDETRVQVLQNVITRHKGKKCYVTEKVDGCSVTYYLRDGEFGVCSRNMELKETPDNAFWKFARENKIEEKLRSLGINMAIQGELIGPGIQKNNLRLPEKKVVFFSVFDIQSFAYSSFTQFKAMITEILQLETVPILETEYILEDDIDKLIEKSKGFSALNPKVHREGIVIRPLIEELDMELSQGFGNGRLSMKVCNPDYLIHYDL